jgi:hypothetical protein
MLYPTFGIVDEMNDIAHLSRVAYHSNPGKFCFLTIVFAPLTPDCQKRYSWLKYPDTYCIRSSCKIRSAQIRLYSLIYPPFPETFHCLQVRDDTPSLCAVYLHHIRESAVLLKCTCLNPVSSWVTISHVTQGREKHDIRDILLSCICAFTPFAHDYG